jgi:hypothetical protein
MTAIRMLAGTLICISLSAATATAAPLSLTLVRTSIVYNEDPPGAPLPLGRTQYDAGDVMFERTKIGEYLRVKDVHAGAINTAAVTLTLFFRNPNGGAPLVITLQGSHDFTTGNEIGGISASSIFGAAGFGFTYNGVTEILTLLFP